MKIQAILSPENKSDILELAGNILKINGKDFDLNNLLSPSVEPDADNTQFFIDNPCYIENGITQLKIYVDNQHFFLFMNNNLKLFFDIDLNDDIDLVELQNMINHLEMTEDQKREDRKAIKDSFTDDEWKLRLKACNPKR